MKVTEVEVLGGTKDATRLLSLLQLLLSRAALGNPGCWLPYSPFSALPSSLQRRALTFFNSVFKILHFHCPDSLRSR